MLRSLRYTPFQLTYMSEYGKKNLLCFSRFIVFQWNVFLRISEAFFILLICFVHLYRAVQQIISITHSEAANLFLDRSFISAVSLDISIFIFFSAHTYRSIAGNLTSVFHFNRCHQSPTNNASSLLEWSGLMRAFCGRKSLQLI